MNTRKEAESVANWAIDEGLLVKVEDEPNSYVIHEDWLTLIEDLEKENWDFILARAETFEDTIQGLAILTYIRFRGEKGVDETELVKAVMILRAYVEGVTQKEREEFLASLRLGERVRFRGFFKKKEFL